MALQKDITDSKGVKTRYHAIKNFACDGEKINIKIRSYTTKAVREAEKEAIDNNIATKKYNQKIADLSAELDGLVGLTDEVSTARIVELTKEINRLSLAKDRPQYTETPERFYSEMEIAMPYFEPISLDLLYDKICQRENCIFSGSTKI